MSPEFVAACSRDRKPPASQLRDSAPAGPRQNRAPPPRPRAPPRQPNLPIIDKTGAAGMPLNRQRHGSMFGPATGVGGTERTPGWCVVCNDKISRTGHLAVDRRGSIRSGRPARIAAHPGQSRDKRRACRRGFGHFFAPDARTGAWPSQRWSLSARSRPRAFPEMNARENFRSSAWR